MAAGKKVRLDKLLVDLGHFESRERAQRSILAGHGLLNRQVSHKPGLFVLPEAATRVAVRAIYVSRGGLKPEGALVFFHIYIYSLRFRDILASTRRRVN